MRGGPIIGLPLTLMQLHTHVHTGAVVDVATIANNFVACSAVYGADRLNASSWDSERLVTRVSALASTAFYMSDPNTQFLAPVVPVLHLWYDDLKPALAPLKPFFIALLWTLTVHAVPVLRTGHGHLDVCSLGAFFLATSAISHAADIRDIAEDAEIGLETPAVLMSRDDCCAAEHYAFGLGLASVALDVASHHPSPVFDGILLVVLMGTLLDQIALAMVMGVVVLGTYAYTHDYETIRWLLRSSDWVHRGTIDLCTRAVEYGLSFPPSPLRDGCLRNLLDLIEHGDEMGGSILRLYARAVKDEVLRR